MFMTQTRQKHFNHLTLQPSEALQKSQMQRENGERVECVRREAGAKNELLVS